MEITSVPIFLERDGLLRAFASIVIDGDFIVKDLRVIENGQKLFVCMPNRKRTDRCLQCGVNNSILARFCYRCGCNLPSDWSLKDVNAFIDIAHPLNNETRLMITDRVLHAYQHKLSEL